MSLPHFFVFNFLPKNLQAQADKACTMLWESLQQKQQQVLLDQLTQSPEIEKQLITALTGSEYVLNVCCRDTDLLLHNILVDAPFAPLTPVKIIDAINIACSDDLELDVFNRLLRRLRRRFMTGIYWRDLNHLADFNETSRAVTALAEACIQQAIDFHYQVLAQKHGTPIGRDTQQVQQMLVVGMGKLGGGELNVSSDIDLLFVFPETGATNHTKKPIDNQQFFNLLGQQVIKSLNEITADGFVFRVDMRLRPYGQSGALCSNFAALENYYQSQGRDWERFAAIKARVVACTTLAETPESFVIEKNNIQQFYDLLKPFIYRKYIDFSMIDSLRKLKALIVQEVHRKGMRDDVKLGAGGIREIEFIAQAFQLIRGGRDSRLQGRNLIATLEALGAQGVLSRKVAEHLVACYIFLRNIEHAIQSHQDEQTQRLPHDEQSLLRLAWLMGFDNSVDFLAKLNETRIFVSQEFQQVIAPPDIDNSEKNDAEGWRLLWENLDNTQLARFDQQDFLEPETLVEQLQQFQKSRHVLSLSTNARDKLDLLMPQLLNVLSDSSAPDRAFSLVLTWLDSIVNRTQYLNLLLENPKILRHLVDLFLGSRWVVETLTRTPVLLDELLYPENLFALPEKAVLQDELRQRFLRLDSRDEEAAMETLRHFRVSHNFHAAAAELSGQLQLMQVSDYLSFTAEVVLEQVLQQAWQALTARHGFPPEVDDKSQPKFLIVGYGKLGGLEMSYSSDLDLVFIYDTEPQAMTDGERPLDTQTFYMRLGQKIIHQLNVRTVSGPLYEVDMRLRPSGNSGLLVSSIQAFTRYQQDNAWTWEHQALVRARPIVGDSTLADQFIELRKQLLSQEREPVKLKQDVMDMRIKMREHLGSGDKNKQNTEGEAQFHLKQDEGGVVDIEFMVQYAVLAWSYKHAALCEWTDNIRILQSLQDSGLISDQHANTLIENYQTYRKISHRLSLQQSSSSTVDGEKFTQQRRQVTALWNEFFKL